MTPRERRARHARDRRDARAEGSRVRPASAHTEREHTIEHYEFHIRENETSHEKLGWTRTRGYEGLGRRLACEMREREGRADAFERAEVPEDHRGLAGPEAENGLIGLAPLFVEQSRAGRRLWAGRALDGSSHTLVSFRK
jgi:hypothetical protein